jgi:hypothetical protein
VPEGVEVVEGPLTLVSGKPELRHLTEERLHVDRGLQRPVEERLRGLYLRPQRRRRRVAFLRLVLGL